MYGVDDDRQQPIVNTIIVPVPEIKQEDLGKWAAPCMTVESGSIFPIPLPHDLADRWWIEQEVSE